MFITFEGLDFCGKSTQVSLLEEYLNNHGKKVKIIREPGGTPISEKIRDVLLDKNNYRMFIESEILLFSASRAQLVREVIKPYLDEGYYVISDRFFDSTTAYQGYGRSIPLEFVNAINKFAVGTTIPDITFFIDLPLVEMQIRKNISERKSLDRIETSADSFYQKVREGYLQIANDEKRFIKIKGTNTISEIHSCIIEEILKKELDRDKK